MKICFFVMLFFVLAVGSASAQKHHWVAVKVPNLSSYFDGMFQIDIDNFERLPNGNVLYWKKVADTVYQNEVDCVDRKFRSLQRIASDHRDSYGNLVRGKESDTPLKMGWEIIDENSPENVMASMACREAPQVTKRVDTPATKKIVKKKLRRKQ
jgi:hypothetical protein